MKEVVLRTTEAPRETTLHAVSKTQDLDIYSWTGRRDCTSAKQTLSILQCLIKVEGREDSVNLKQRHLSQFGLYIQFISFSLGIMMNLYKYELRKQKD